MADDDNPSCSADANLPTYKGKMVSSSDGRGLVRYVNEPGSSPGSDTFSSFKLYAS